MLYTMYRINKVYSVQNVNLVFTQRMRMNLLAGSVFELGRQVFILILRLISEVKPEFSDHPEKYPNVRNYDAERMTDCQRRRFSGLPISSLIGIRHWDAEKG